MQASATGQQHELRSGQHVAVVVETGGGLRRYAYAGREVVDGYPAESLPDAARGQLLVPWPNRVRDGRYRWDGVDQQLALTEPGACNAIHGLVRTLPFAVRARDDATVTLGATLLPQRGYPHRLDVAVTYALAADGLAVTVSARNTGETDAPYAVGQHPYISVGTEYVDDAVLTLPTRHWLRTDGRGLPVGRAAVTGSPFDFRNPRRLGATPIDTAFGGLMRDPSGRAITRLANPEDGFTVDVWAGTAASHLQVFTGDTLADPDRRRRGLAVEPMSAPPDAFRSGEGLVRLQPGRTHRFGWGITPATDRSAAVG